jgi:DNA transformation protein and related proteins
MSGDFIDYMVELLGPFGTVDARPMFGGHGIYLDSLMFALVSDDTLYLKSDEMNKIEFEQAGCEIFTYVRKGKRATLGFYRPPEEALESAQLMLPWARTAYAAALRASAKKQVAARAVAAAQPAAPAKALKTAKPKKSAPKKKTAKSKSARPAKKAAARKRNTPTRR